MIFFFVTTWSVETGASLGKLGVGESEMESSAIVHLKIRKNLKELGGWLERVSDILDRFIKFHNNQPDFVDFFDDWAAVGVRASSDKFKGGFFKERDQGNRAAK